MSVIIDSYNESNCDSYTDLSEREKYGQSFTATPCVLDSVKFFLRRGNGATGNAYAKVYAHSGTYGLNSIPTGSPLATSDAFDVTTLPDYGIASPVIPDDFTLSTFTFSGANRINLSAGYYVVTIEFSGYLYVGATLTPTHSGNWSWYIQPWNGTDTTDIIFYVYGVASKKFKKGEQIFYEDISEDFSTYTKVDSGSDITVASNICVVDTMRRDANSAVYKDYGVGYFKNFTHKLEFCCTQIQAQALGIVWAVSNTPAATWQDLAVAAVGMALLVYNNGTNTLMMFEQLQGPTVEDTYTMAVNTPYYCTIVKDNSSLKCYIYSNPSRTNLLDTLTVSRSATEYQYINSVGSRDSGSSADRTISYYVRKLKGVS